MHFTRNLRYSLSTEPLVVCDNNNEKDTAVVDEVCGSQLENRRDTDDKLSVDRELTGAEKTLAEETDIDAEEAPLPDSTADEFSRGVTDLDAAKDDDDEEGLKDKKVNSSTTLIAKTGGICNI